MSQKEEDLEALEVSEDFIGGDGSSKKSNITYIILSVLFILISIVLIYFLWYMSDLNKAIRAVDYAVEACVAASKSGLMADYLIAVNAANDAEVLCEQVKKSNPAEIRIYKEKLNALKCGLIYSAQLAVDAAIESVKKATASADPVDYVNAANSIVKAKSSTDAARQAYTLVAAAEPAILTKMIGIVDKLRTESVISVQQQAVQSVKVVKNRLDEFSGLVDGMASIVNNKSMSSRSNAEKALRMFIVAKIMPLIDKCQADIQTANSSISAAASLYKKEDGTQIFKMPQDLIEASAYMVDINTWAPSISLFQLSLRRIANEDAGYKKDNFPFFYKCAESIVERSASGAENAQLEGNTFFQHVTNYVNWFIKNYPDSYNTFNTKIVDLSYDKLSKFKFTCTIPPIPVNKASILGRVDDTILYIPDLFPMEINTNNASSTTASTINELAPGSQTNMSITPNYNSPEGSVQNYITQKITLTSDNKMATGTIVNNKFNPISVMFEGYNIYKDIVFEFNSGKVTINSIGTESIEPDAVSKLSPSIARREIGSAVYGSNSSYTPGTLAVLTQQIPAGTSLKFTITYNGNDYITIKINGLNIVRSAILATA